MLLHINTVTVLLVYSFVQCCIQHIPHLQTRGSVLPQSWARWNGKTQQAKD